MYKELEDFLSEKRTTAKVHKIAILTSGGDAPGMNAATRAVVRYALNCGLDVFGIYKGYNGLLHDDIEQLNAKSVARIIHEGGTKLYTARCKEFYEESYQKKGADIARSHGIDGLVVIGGDGSFRGAQTLSHNGINVACIPATIDLDIACTDYTLGFDTAANIALDAVRRLRDTTASHERCSIVEVMGRHCGELALWTGIAGGADLTIIPEMPQTAEYHHILSVVKANRERGKDHSLIVVAEGVAKDGLIVSCDDLAKRIEADTGIVSRATILGHIQRGGCPTVLDVKHATMMGVRAVDCLLTGQTNRVVAFKDNRYVDFDIDEALAMKKPVSTDIYQANQCVSSY